MILESVSTDTLTLVLIVLFILSAFFSGSETALMSVNRYRLTHLARQGDKRAHRVMQLLKKPDRLIGLILFGNNFTNILIAQLATLLGYRLYGDAGIAAVTGILTFLLLIFAELAPKTLSALHPQAVAIPAALIYTAMMPLLYPMVWFINLFANSLLKMLGVSRTTETVNPLSREELRTVLASSSRKISSQYRDMLFGILDLEKKTVEDIMIPRNEIVGINIDGDPEDIEAQLTNSDYTRIPVYHGNINTAEGILHLREVPAMIGGETITREILLKAVRPPFYIAENSTLLRALMDFKKQRHRLGLAVDEYGDVQGLVTLEDLLEEIVGEFTDNPATYEPEIEQQEDGSVIVDGGCHIRELNRALNWHLNESGPKTINGVVLEYLETMPGVGTCVLIDGHPIEVIRIWQNAIKAVKISAKLPSTDTPEKQSR